ncbi:hypothetical protein ScPMuIL_010143 [Solemya velum]
MTLCLRDMKLLPFLIVYLLHEFVQVTGSPVSRIGRDADLTSVTNYTETRKYIYLHNWYLICKYCPLVALLNEVPTNPQVSECVKQNRDRRDDWEIANDKYPYCLKGETPVCPSLDEIENGSWECTFPVKKDVDLVSFNHTHPPVYTQCQAVCRDGHRLDVLDHGMLYCRESRQWDFPQPRHCIPEVCPSLDEIENGSWDCTFPVKRDVDLVSFNHTHPPVYTQCQAICLDGHRLDVLDGGMLECQQSLQWDLPQPRRCIPEDAAKNFSEETRQTDDKENMLYPGIGIAAAIVIVGLLVLTLGYSYHQKILCFKDPCPSTVNYVTSTVEKKVLISSSTLSGTKSTSTQSNASCSSVETPLNDESTETSSLLEKTNVTESDAPAPKLDIASIEGQDSFIKENSMPYMQSGPISVQKLPVENDNSFSSSGDDSGKMPVENSLSLDTLKSNFTYDLSLDKKFVGEKTGDCIKCEPLVRIDGHHSKSAGLYDGQPKDFEVTVKKAISHEIVDGIRVFHVEQGTEVFIVMRSKESKISHSIVRRSKKQQYRGQMERFPWLHKIKDIELGDGGEYQINVTFEDSTQSATYTVVIEVVSRVRTSGDGQDKEEEDTPKGGGGGDTDEEEGEERSHNKSEAEMSSRGQGEEREGNEATPEDSSSSQIDTDEQQTMNIDQPPEIGPGECTMYLHYLMGTDGTYELFRKLAHKLDPDTPGDEKSVYGLARSVGELTWDHVHYLKWHLKGNVENGPTRFVIEEILVPKGKTLGHIVHYYSQRNSKNFPVVELIKEHHSECPHCQQYYGIAGTN